MATTGLTGPHWASLGLSMAALSAREWIDVKGRKMQADFESFDPDANLVTWRKLEKVHKITLDQFSENTADSYQNASPRPSDRKL
jgi:hypothetical protein